MLQDYPRLKEDVLWLLKETDKLEDTRNTAIHSPLLTESNNDILSLGDILTYHDILRRHYVAPNIRLKNSRAMKLAQKDLLAEFRWCRDAALLLRDFALSLDAATMPDEIPWPDRHSLPNRGQYLRRRLHKH